jgi:hypothetical protein
MEALGYSVMLVSVDKLRSPKLMLLRIRYEICQAHTILLHAVYEIGKNLTYKTFSHNFSIQADDVFDFVCFSGRTVLAVSLKPSGINCASVV